MLAGYAVAGSAPSRQEDFVRETAALADADAEDGRRGQTEKVSLQDVRDRALKTCRAVAGVLKTKAMPEEAYEYKRWVLVVAEKVASAAKEGGLFGFGGEQVGGEEVTTINEIGEAIEI